MTDDVQDDVLIVFEQGTYGATEGQPTVEVCAVANVLPSPGQTVSAQISTEDDTAIGTSNKINDIRFVLCVDNHCGSPVFSCYAVHVYCCIV